MNVEFSEHTSIKEREQIIELLNNMKLNGKKAKSKTSQKQKNAKRKKENKRKEQKEANRRKHMPYNEYLQSEYWKHVKIKVLKRDHYHCVKCRRKSNLNIHHLTYQNRGNELKHLHDLITLCRKCHEKIHNKCNES